MYSQSRSNKIEFEIPKAISDFAEEMISEIDRLAVESTDNTLTTEQGNLKLDTIRFLNELKKLLGSHISIESQNNSTKVTVKYE